MAFFFSLSIECGADQAAAASCADHFGSWELPPECALPNRTIRVSFQQESSGDPIWWAVVVPLGVSQSGVWSEDVAHEMSAAGVCLFDRLKTAPPFRFALIGVESQEAILRANLDRHFAQDPTLADRYRGLVISQEIRDQLGASPVFGPFAPGYFWIPYRGETFSKIPG